MHHYSPDSHRGDRQRNEHAPFVRLPKAIKCGTYLVSGCWIDHFVHLCTLLGKYPHAATLREKSEAPLQADEQPARKSDKEVDMHTRPDQPCWEARKPGEAQICHGIGSAHDCQLAFIPVPERLELWAARETA